MPLFDSEYEGKLFNDRKTALDKIVAIVQELNPGTPDLAARFPNAFRFTHTVPQLRAEGDPLSAEQLEATPVHAAIAGRLVAIRGGFAVLQQDGARIQIYVHKDSVGEPLQQLFKLLHIGDHIGVRGTLMRTRTGELTLKAVPDADGPALTFLSKAMLALPDKYSGLEDIETRYRQRYVDLIMNAGHAVKTEGSDEEALNVRATFVKRAAVLRAIRKFFDERGYLEVETPMLHTIAGGAAARPFQTHHNALDIPLNLRIAPELHLKRLVVGGLDRVYEINRNFRNEGVSTQHNPEFTMLEFYQAYANYHDLMELTEELIKFVAIEVNGKTTTNFPIPKGPRAGEVVEIDLAKWQKLSMREAIVRFWDHQGGPAPTAAIFETPGTFKLWADTIGVTKFKDSEQPIDPFSDSPEAKLHGRMCTIQSYAAEAVSGIRSFGKAISDTFELVAEEHLIQPTMIYDFPLAVSPLSKINPQDPEWVERFEFYIGGFEVGNAFSELNDAEDQLRRFEAQLEDRARGDEEAMAQVDDDYVRALGYGLPPTAGEGIGIDRLTMILTGSRSIRDVILFPLLRPHAKVAEASKEGGESAE